MGAYTHLRPLFEALGGWPRRHSWLLTDWECSPPYPSEFPWDPDSPPRLLTGADLTALVDRCDPHFVWGVLSSFVPGTEPDARRLVTQPYADGNSELWLPDGPVQYPGAVTEIVCWDASCAIITAEDEETHRLVRAYFPEAMPMPPLDGLRARYGPPHV